MKRRDFFFGIVACTCANHNLAFATSSEEDISFCTIMPPEDEILSRAAAANEWAENESNNSSEGAVLRAKRWNPSKRELRVAFLVENRLSQRVFNAAKGWESHMPLRFKKVALNGRPEIIVGFRRGKGHWSYVGTDSGLYARRGIQTMNFGWRSNPSNSEVRRVALHEFGHAMGLIHEQSTPGADISWNRPAVYKLYEREQGWTPKQTERNVLRRYAESQVNRTEYDPNSIMHYPVDRKLVTDPNDVVGWNSNLSSADKAMVNWLWK